MAGDNRQPSSHFRDGRLRQNKFNKFIFFSWLAGFESMIRDVASHVFLINPSVVPSFTSVQLSCFKDRPEWRYVQVKYSRGKDLDVSRDPFFCDPASVIRLRLNLERSCRTIITTYMCFLLFNSSVNMHWRPSRQMYASHSNHQARYVCACCL